ncbi:MAG: YbaK/EbsC family protein [Chloroflexi bacterium]|nr:YbaK/EbsC family protein [Chloroflexota bacterium]
MSHEGLRQFLATHRVDATLLPDVGETPTVEAAARALGVAPEHVIKTLLFLVDGRPVLFIVNGPERVDKRVLARYFRVGRKKVKLADGKTVEELTGYPPGGVPPFGHKTRVPVLIHPRVLTLEVVYGGGGDERSMLRVSPQEIVRVTQATVLPDEAVSQGERS